MLNVQNVALALVLTTPFGLAIHDELTKETLDAEEIGALDFYGGFGDGFGDGLDGDEFGALHGDDYEDDYFGRAYDDGDRYLGEDPYAEEEALEAEVVLMGEDGRSELFGTDKATLGPTLSDARFGMTHPELVAAIPTIESGALGDPEMFSGVTVYPEYQAADSTKLTSLNVVVTDQDDVIATWLSERWGRPDLIDEGNDLVAWFSADGHTRAALRTEIPDILEIEFSQVQSVRELFARPNKGKGLFSFESSPPLLQASVKDLGRAYPSAYVDPYFEEYAKLDLPGIITDPNAKPHLEVLLTLRENKVVRVEFELPCQLETCFDVLDAAKSRYGKAQDVAMPDGHTLRFGKALTMTVYDGSDTVEVVATFDKED